VLGDEAEGAVAEQLESHGARLRAGNKQVAGGTDTQSVGHGNEAKPTNRGTLLSHPTQPRGVCGV
jgi:hypothetical protein